MTLLEAMDKRVSRRTYISKPLSEGDAAALTAQINEYSQTGFRMELIVGNGDAFAGLRKSYGLFSGVLNYIVMVADNYDATAEEKLGYYGELLVLYATMLGLGTCWIGMYDKKSCPIAISEHEHVALVIAVGYINDKLTIKERLMHGVTHRKIKSLAELSTTDTTPPDWFVAGVSAAQKAPSAVNRQPVTFDYRNRIVTASVKDITTPAMAIDLGIAKAHFAIAAGGTWQWGNAESFIKAA